MAYLLKLLVVIFASSIASAAMISERKFDTASTLSTRLKLDEENSTSCWDVLLELQSCSGEVVMFFLNGEAHLGANCCKAISTIQHHCWPSMLGALGITTEESDILRGYCDAIAEDDSSTTTATLVYPGNNTHA